MAEREGDGTAAWVLAARHEGELRPSFFHVRLQPGFEEPPPIAVDLWQRDQAWSIEMTPGLERPDQPSQGSGLLAAILTNRLWQPYAGARYDALAGRDKPAQTPAGLESRRRDIDEVLRDTVFTPRL